MLPYRRHRNGGGKIYGDVADVSRDTFLDRTAAVTGNSSVAASQIYQHSHVEDASFFEAITYNSYVQGSFIYKSRLADCAVIDSTIRSHYGKWPVLHGTRLRGVHVEGDWLGSWALDGPYYIRSGVWTRPPRHLTLSDESGIYVGLTESTEGRAFIACNERPVSEWLKSGIRIGLHLKWPRELCEQAYRFMEELADVQIERAA